MLMFEYLCMCLPGGLSATSRYKSFYPHEVLSQESCGHGEIGCAEVSPKTGPRNPNPVASGNVPLLNLITWLRPLTYQMSAADRVSIRRAGLGFKGTPLNP